MQFYADTQGELETQVVILFDRHKQIKTISRTLHITPMKTLRILERHARVIPPKCLHCNKLLLTHSRCPHCSILLHEGSQQCWPSCIKINYKNFL